MLQRTYPLDGHLDLHATLAPLQHGAGDPTLRVDGPTIWRATRTAAGPATVAARVEGDQLVAEAWGDGAALALDQLPDVAGLTDRHADWRTEHPAVGALQERRPGLRIPHTHAIIDALVGTLLEERVTTFEAHRGYDQVVRAYSEEAPGPADLWLPPDAAAIADAAYYDLHVLGIERVRAETLVRLAAGARRIEALGSLPPAEARARLTELPGVAAGTAARVALMACGDADAVPVGDPLLPVMVAWTLEGEAGADDSRMLELLEPFAPNRGRVIRLVEQAGDLPPRHGPRYGARDVRDA